MTRTRDEIMQMSPHKLNWAIAEAKGWKIVDYGRGYLTPVGKKDDWTHDIAAAWGLVEEMLDAATEYSLKFSFVITYDEDGYYAQAPDLNPGSWANAPTISLAISRVWLMWRESR